MRRYPYCNYITHNKFCQVLAPFLAILLVVFAIVVSPILSAIPARATSSSHVYFDSDVFDFYLQKTDQGTSKMHVKEVLSATFPDENVSHGPTITISYTNQAGKNRTIKDLNALNFKALRNGESEPIAKVEDSNSAYTFYLGKSSEYLHGSQIYTLEYDYENVITSYDASGALSFSDIAFEELYWDTNGNSSTSDYGKVTANVHIPATEAKHLNGKSACYVGYLNSNDQSRCTITSDDHTTYNPSALNADEDTQAETIITFFTYNLSAGENLTFSIGFDKDAYVVPAPENNYILVIITVLVAGISLLLFILFYKKWLTQGKPNKDYYKSLFLAPQYQAPKGYAVAEASHLSLKAPENSYVATLLELAVTKKISIIKGEPTKVLKKDQWMIKILDTKDLTPSQTDLLEIINNGEKVSPGDTIKIEKHAATSTLASLSTDYDKSSLKALKKLDLLTSESTGKSGVLVIVVFLFAFGIIFGGSYLTSFFRNILSNGNVIGIEFLPAIIAILIIATIVVLGFLLSENNKYKRFTKSGIDAVKYLEGLRLYINMAEKDRLDFLQSVKGADTSDTGIVKLYEKLLPYASLFGLEKSWLKELGKYCEKINYVPEWSGGSNLSTFYAISSLTNTFSSDIISSTRYSSSSSSAGSSSSGFSGSFGGGFSGGGGGGGGRGSW